MSCKYCDETKAFKLTEPISAEFPFAISYIENLEGWVLYNPSNQKFGLQLPYGYIGEAFICPKCGRSLSISISDEDIEKIADKMDRVNPISTEDLRKALARSQKSTT